MFSRVYKCTSPSPVAGIPILDLLVGTDFYNRTFKMPAMFLPLTFCYITFCYNIWRLFTSLNSPTCLHCLEGADDPMHKFKISVVKLLNIVLGIVSSIYAIVNNYLKQGSNWSIWPCCHIYKVSDAFSHPERFPTALLHEDQQYVAKRSSLFGSCSWFHLSCVLYFL